MMCICSSGRMSSIQSEMARRSKIQSVSRPRHTLELSRHVSRQSRYAKGRLESLGEKVQVTGRGITSHHLPKLGSR